MTVSYTATSGIITTRTYSGGLTLAGDDGNNTLTGSSSNETLISAGGNDTLDGGAGNDLLIGGGGNDILIGGTGADRYQIGRATGQDLLQTYDADGGADVLELGVGVARDQLWFSRNGDDLIVSIIGTTDNVTVQDWYDGADYQLAGVKLADGATASASDVEQLVNAMASFSRPTQFGQHDEAGLGARPGGKLAELIDRIISHRIA